MSKTIKGYYLKQKDRLMKDFGQTIKLMNYPLNERFGNELSLKIEKEILLEYENLISEIPYTAGFRSKMFNNFIIITAQELAAYKVLSRYDLNNDEIWELFYQAICLRLKAMNLWKKRLISLFWNLIFSNMLKIRAWRNKKEYLAGFELEYISGQGEGFDIGINYTRCGNYDFMNKHGGEEFAPYICLTDIALSKAFNWGLNRTKTIADGCDYCDFRFKKNSPTEVSSKLPEVQQVIEKTADKYKIN